VAVRRYDDVGLKPSAAVHPLSAGVLLNATSQYRVAKTHKISYLYRSFSAKVTYI